MFAESLQGNPSPESMATAKAAVDVTEGKELITNNGNSAIKKNVVTTGTVSYTHLTLPTIYSV